MSARSPDRSRYRADEKINVDILIEEVRKRRPLYLKTYTEEQRTNNFVLWTEVCQELFRAFKEYSPKKKREKVQEVQNKWRNLKATFTRSLTCQHHLTPTGRKKRKYQYYEQLSFLIPTLATYDVGEEYKVEVELDHAIDLSNHKKREEIVPGASTSQNVNFDDTSTFRENGGSSTELPKAELPKIDEIDESTYFGMMVSSILKKLNIQQKFQAMSEILRILSPTSLIDQKNILHRQFAYNNGLVTAEHLNIIEERNVMDVEPISDDSDDVNLEV